MTTSPNFSSHVSLGLDMPGYMETLRDVIESGRGAGRAKTPPKVKLKSNAMGMVHYTEGGPRAYGNGTAELTGLPATFLGWMPGKISSSPLRLTLLTTAPSGFISYPVETQRGGGAVFQDLPRVWLGTHAAITEVVNMLEAGGIEPDPDYYGVMDAELQDAAEVGPDEVRRWLAAAKIALRVSAAALPGRMAASKTHQKYGSDSLTAAAQNLSSLAGVSPNTAAQALKQLQRAIPSTSAMARYIATSPDTTKKGTPIPKDRRGLPLLGAYVDEFGIKHN